ncbi:MAG: p20 [Bacillus sp. (in: firmicutes)]|jgi:phage minor structural protein|nr:p20 [Bacillus sp. (in: firmicutes)]
MWRKDVMLLLVVTDLFGNTEALTDFQNVEINEEVNGDFSLSFLCFYTEKNEHSYPLVQEESIVEWNEHEFVIKKLTESRNRKEVAAQHVFFETIDNQIYTINEGTLSLDDAVTFALNGSGWTFENVGVTASKFIPNFGEDNTLSLIRKICAEFQCEVKIEPGRHLKFVKEIGENQDFQFRYKHNIKAIKRTVDTSNFATVVKGFGADGLVVEYRSPNIAIYGEKHGEPIRDERFTSAENLLAKCQQEIRDVPEVSIELEVSQLGFEAGLGDKVWLIYEPLKIEFQTRVLAIKSYPFVKLSPAVVLSNQKRTFTDLLTQTSIEVKENKKETRSKIEQTNESITLAVERIGEAEAQILVQADQITTKVSQTDYNGNTIASLINQTATTVLIQAENIELDGIVRVNKSLYIGSESEYDTKTLWFNNAANLSATGFGYGGVSEMKFGTSNINFEYVDDIFFRNFGITTRVNGNLDFQYANVTGLNVIASFG